MNLKKPETVLALGSGAAMGLAHIGAIKAIREKGIRVDMITGSSMGALVGAAYARYGRIKELEDIALNMDWRKALHLIDPNLLLLHRGLIHGKKVEKFFAAITGHVKFSDLKIPLAIVATDIHTGKEVIIREGSVVEAVRASISIPGVFSPVKFKGLFLVDGGVSNPVPVSVARKMGAKRVIAVNVINKPGGRNLTLKQKALKSFLKKKKKNTSLPVFNNKISELIKDNLKTIQRAREIADGLKSKIRKKSFGLLPDSPNIFETITQAIYIMEYKIALANSMEADIVINPDTSGIDVFEFYRGKEAIKAGYEEAKRVLARVLD